MGAVLALRRRVAVDQVLFACLPAGPLTVKADGQAKQIKPTASEQREQSVADAGRIQEIDSLAAEIFFDPEPKKS